jgi:hypothetical protein
VFLPLHKIGEALWDLLVTFPFDYPFVAPVFRFLAPPPLVHVTEHGRLMKSSLPDYTSGTRIAQLLLTIAEFETDPETRHLRPADSDSRINGGIFGGRSPISNIQQIKKLNRKNPDPVPVGDSPLPDPCDDDFAYQ